MHKHTCLTLLMCAMALTMDPLRLAAQTRGDYYVSPSGRDTWSGRLAARNRAKTDGPFATVKRAQEAVRLLRKTNPKLGRAVRVVVRGGTYALTEPLRFSPEDSGSPASPTIYAGYAGEQAVLSGGVRITEWTKDAKGWWRVRLPEVAAGRWSFQQLFVNGERRYRPRLPKSGYYNIEDALPPTPAAQGKGADRFRFRAGELRGDWHDMGSVEVLAFQNWSMSRLRVKSVDEADRAVTFTGPTWTIEAYGSLPKGNRYLVENVRESLSEPGEFYLDRATGELTYLPKPGEDPAAAVVIAPKLDTLVEMNGDPAARRWVERVRFERLTFAYTNWNTPLQGSAIPQAEAALGAAISAKGTRDIDLLGCRITHAGAYAVDFGEGCKRCRLRDCRMTDLGAGGVKIGLRTLVEDDERVASDNTVRDCVIAHGGRVHPAAVGVLIGHSYGNSILANEIADLYYTGVSVGWSWGYGKSLAHHNLIEGNRIHDLGQGVLSDMGGIYTLGLSHGTVLRGNRIHDVQSFGYGGWAIYPDEGSTGILIENNVAFRTKSAPFHQHYGRENIVRNNIFAFGHDSQLMRSREDEILSFTIERNIVYWREGTLLGSYWTNGKFAFKDNLYWNAAGQPINFAGKSLEEWRISGQDKNSVIADPLFVDPERGDFRLKPGSPAVKLGFRPIDPAVAAVPRESIRLAPPAFPTVKP